MSHTIGLDLGGTMLKGGIVSASGALVYATEAPSQLHDHPEELTSRLAVMVPKLQAYAGEHGLPVVGIGLSSTIDVNSRTGRFKYASEPYLRQWVNFPISDFLSEQFGLPAEVEHDGFAAAWGEYRAGAGRGYSSVLVMTLGTGVGGGAILEGQILPQSVGAGGASFGHMSINYDGPVCACGNRGCLETYVSATAFARRAAAAVRDWRGETLLKATPTGREVTQAAQQGDGLARRVLEETGHDLGLGLVNLANLFNPEIIVIGGGLAQAGEYLLARARDTLNRLRLPLRETVVVTCGELGPYCGVIGAALLVQEELERREAQGSTSDG